MIENLKFDKSKIDLAILQIAIQCLAYQTSVRNVLMEKMKLSQKEIVELTEKIILQLTPQRIK